MITLYHSILRLISTTTIILKTLSIIINDETVIDKNEDHHYPHEVDIDMDDDDSADEDYEFHFSLENDNLLDLAAVNENQLKEDVEFLINDLLDFENKNENSNSRYS